MMLGTAASNTLTASTEVPSKLTRRRDNRPLLEDHVTRLRRQFGPRHQVHRHRPANGRLDRERAREDGELAECGLVPFAEQVIAPADDSSDRPMACVQHATIAGQEVERKAAEGIIDLLEGQRRRRAGRRATSSARQVLPTPPGPAIVTSRAVSSSSVAAASSTTRPSSGVAAAGRRGAASWTGGRRLGSCRRMAASSSRRSVPGSTRASSMSVFRASTQARSASTCVVQGPDDKGVQPLTEGRVREEFPQLTDHGGGAPGPEIGGQAALQGVETLLLQPGGGADRPGSSACSPSAGPRHSRSASS